MDLSQVTLSQMRYAVAVAELRNFRLAAEAVHVSQSGLSMQIQKLEELLELTLFDRSKKPVLVSPAAESVLEQMRLVLRETEKLAQLAQDEREPAGRYRLGVIPTLSATVIPLFLRPFLDAYPRVELLIEELKTEDIIARLQMDTLDGGLAATPLHVPGFYEHTLGLESMFAYLPSGDPLLKRKMITQIELSKRQLWVMPEGHCFRSQVLSYCEMKGKSASAPIVTSAGRVTFESGSFETLIRLVDDGLGATILPALVCDQLPANRIKQLRPLTSPVPVREIGLVTARATLRRAVTDALVNVARQALRNALPHVSRRSQVLDPRET